MLTLNAMSGAAYHYGLFGADSNPGVFLYAGFLTFYVLDYFISRQRDDDRLCAEKYGAEKWAEYQARVKYRIIPGIY